MEFWGYERNNGEVGSRNLVGIIPSCGCAEDVVRAIVSQVQGTVGFYHHQGCSQTLPDLQTVNDTLSALGSGPNLGAVLVVSLGCEGADAEYIAGEIAKTGKPVELIKVLSLGGVTPGIAAGTEIARRLAEDISPLRRTPVDISRAIMSIKCGVSDSTSGPASNSVIGYVADKLVDLGGTVVFGETTEFIGAEHILARRAITPQVGQEIINIVNDMENRAKSMGADMRKGQPSRGNIEGGLSSIEEKSLGAIHKSGSRPIQGVLDYPDRITTHKGLWIKDTPGREPEILMGMGATGAHVMLFSTGGGAPQGFPSMPVVKICGNPNTFLRNQCDMDLNAGTVITGERSIEQVGEEAFGLMVETLSGRVTKSEAIGYTSCIEIQTKGPVI